MKAMEGLWGPDAVDRLQNFLPVDPGRAPSHAVHLSVLTPPRWGSSPRLSGGASPCVACPLDDQRGKPLDRKSCRTPENSYSAVGFFFSWPNLE